MRNKKIEITILFSIFILLVSAFVVFASPTTAFNQNEVSASTIWSSTAFFPGDYGQANITLVSNCSQNIQIDMIGIHFDWNKANSYFYQDFNISINLRSRGSYTFPMTAFYITPQVNASSHTYNVHFEGTQEGQSPQNITWNSPTFTIQVYTAEAAYNQLQPQVMNQMVQAQKVNYQSSEAKTLVENATDAYNQATSLAKQNQWQAAAADLQNAATLFDNAGAKEHAFVAPSYFPEEVIAGVSVVVISALLILMVRKRRKPR